MYCARRFFRTNTRKTGMSALGVVVKMLCHDPRLSNDREQRVETTNIELIARELMRQKYPGIEIDWSAVKLEADYCENRVIRQF